MTEPIADPSGPMRRVGVAVPAAGAGRRMGGARKPFIELHGEPALLWALRPFLAIDAVSSVVVALDAESAASPPAWLLEEDDRVKVTAGGETRRDSVWNAIAELDDAVELIAVHDAARPLLSVETVRACIAVAEGGTGAVAGVPAVDTMKLVDGAGRVLSTPDRSTLWHAQTPQVFPRALLVDAYRRALAESWPVTDDASVVERAGGAIEMVRASALNLKLTRPEDIDLAEFHLRSGRA